MERKPDVSIVVTLLNEQPTVETLYERTIAAVDGRSFEVLFVDDGSTDGTYDVVRRLHERDPRVRAIRFSRNFGQHPAMHAGFTRARGDILVTMDGDLQNQPEDIPKLVAAIEAGADVASGRRIARRDSWGRTLPSRLIYGIVFWIERSNFPGPLLGGTLIVFVLGVQGFILALVGEYLGRIQRQVEGRRLYSVAEEL